MDAETLIAQLLADPAPSRLLNAPLPDDVAAALVERLKEEADRHWAINANRSLELADLIVQIGEARGDLRQTALGMMARGDAHHVLGRSEVAWELLDQAGALFQAAGDEVGWARTRIGRLGICVDLNRVEAALADAAQARAIFTRYGEHERRLRLDCNALVVFYYLGDRQRAQAVYHAAIDLASSLGQPGQEHVASLTYNIGLVYEAIGDFHAALRAYRRARALFEQLGETRHAALADSRIARIAMIQGHYRRALDVLHPVQEFNVAQHLPWDAAITRRTIVECYISLNRYAEARDLARQASAAFRALGASYQEALTLLQLATTEAELGDFAAAQTALGAAEPLFAALKAQSCVATTRLRRGRIALLQGDARAAQREALAAAAGFEAQGEQVAYAAAILLHGQALLLDDRPAAAQHATTALRIARRSNVPPLRYAAHLLLGRVAEAEDRVDRARRRYRAAAATVARVERDLTITLRPGFLEDKGEALRALIALHLRAGQPRRAFEDLERAKSQVLLGYLANREQLRWVADDERARALIAELDQLRAEHHWLYQVAHDQPLDADARPGAIGRERARDELAARERRMRAITEQLYLHSPASAPIERAQVSARALQERLGEDALLIEYYNDGARLWAFTLDQRAIEVHLLPIAVHELDRLLAQLQANLAFALGAGPDAPATRGLASTARRLFQRLYAALVEPFAPRLQGRQQLIVVPYGALHYLPFHLLHDASEYLIERYEVVVLPAAGLAMRPGPTRPQGALALAHSWGGRLPATADEARLVQRLFGGTIACEQAARRAAIEANPTQILHIAAHGEYRLDQPDLSYIELADGHLYTDDLLQHDLSYELVTLSACETGRANVAAGDELIGLGRGFLYAGAGALIVSLWRVADILALALIEQVYLALRAGASKAAALRAAQQALRASHPHLHPAFWGAYQLVGDPRPLSAALPDRKENLDERLSAGV